MENRKVFRKWLSRKGYLFVEVEQAPYFVIYGHRDPKHWIEVKTWLNEFDMKWSISKNRLVSNVE